MTLNTHQSLERGLSVLEIVADAGRPISLAEISKMVCLHRSTVHHMLQALVSMGYLDQQEHSRAYEPSEQLRLLAKRIVA